MVCDRCGRAGQDGDRFCTGCGTALPPAAGSGPEPGAVEPIRDEPTEPIPASPTPAAPTPAAADHWDVDDPVWALTGSLPVVDTGSLPVTEAVAAVDTGSLPVTEAVAAMPTLASAAPVLPAADPSAHTGQVPAATAEFPLVPVVPAARARFRPTAVTLLAFPAGVVTLLAMFTDIATITSDTRLDATPEGFRTGSWIADELADNLSIAGLLAVLLIMTGGLAAGFRWRWGSGLAGGAGLAVAGLAALAIGLAQVPIDAAHEFAAIPNDTVFTLTITRDLGYWLLLAAGAIGIVLFFAAIDDSWDDRRNGLNPWIAALGGLATLVAVAGPLLPEGQAVFSDNWYLVEGPGQAPAMLVAGRLVQLGMLLVAGVIGFLSVRRWGLGLAIGGAVPVVWLATSTLFELTGHPVGPGFRNPGAEGMHLHGVTIIGVSALFAMSVLAAIAAHDQSVRERL
ncbi:MAG TPA: zinc ribbon domain-containing protein [Ilumatobacter sp.]